MNSPQLLLGIDLGGTKTAVVLGDANGTVHARVEFPTTAPEETRRRIVDAASGWEFSRVGIACGGPLDVANGRLLAPPNLPGWEGADLVSWFEKDFQKPVALVNDANAGALAEWRWGAGRGTTDMVFLTCGTGLGAGIISGGRLLAGFNGNAGEIGHVRLTETGPQGYGKAGSVEGWSSGGGIGRQAIVEGWPSGTTAKDVVLAAEAGEAKAKHLLEVAGEMLGRSIALLIDVLNPQVVILGSLYVRAARFLEPAMRRALESEALPELLGACRIVPAELGESIGDLQALAAAMEAPDESPTGPLAELLHRRPELIPLREEIREAADLLLESFRKGGNVLIAGNGGSAADADHWAGELMKGFESKRPLSPAERENLPPEYAGKLQQAVPCIPLTGFPALRTAVANDIDPTLEFAQLVMALGRPDSLFIGISTSGNATNVCAAAQVAKARGLKVLGLTGEGGGRLADYCDLCLKVPAVRTLLVQELHLPIYHTLCLIVENEYFPYAEN